ncbi:LapA family protein [Streptomyces sp. NPDC020362]|uniref:LapA family protein n=1 Tax=unclassified Streptomyces TaxID=2593676 RepID=UPI000A4666A1
MSPKTSDGDTATGGRGGLTAPARITVHALAVLALILVFENTGATRIRLLGPEVTMPLWTALLATGLIGALCGAYAVRRRDR